MNTNNDKKLLQFGLILAGSCLFWACLLWYFKKPGLLPYFLTAAPLLAFTAILRPAHLQPLKIVFEKAGFYLTTAVGAVILCIMYYLLITPIGLALKVFGADILGKKSVPHSGSYWQKPALDGKINYEEQY